MRGVVGVSGRGGFEEGEIKAVGMVASRWSFFCWAIMVGVARRWSFCDTERARGVWGELLVGVMSWRESRFTKRRHIDGEVGLRSSRAIVFVFEQFGIWKEVKKSVVVQRLGGFSGGAK